MIFIGGSETQLILLGGPFKPSVGLSGAVGWGLGSLGDALSYSCDGLSGVADGCPPDGCILCCCLARRRSASC